jgi:hypothetical protein
MLPIVVGSLFCCFQALLMIYDAVASLRSGDLGESTEVEMEGSSPRKVVE